MICLSFDTDYVQPADMEIFLREFPIPGRGTFFLDRRYDGVDFKDHEIGPHPFIYDGEIWQEKLKTSEEFLQNRRKIGFRSHSLVFSQIISAQLAKMNYLYTSIDAPFYQKGLQPRRQPWGIWELPIFYMDNADFCYPMNWPDLNHKPFHPKVIEMALQDDGVYVFDFHPLHIILNTSSFADYQSVRSKVLAGQSPFDYSFPGYGTRSFYLDLVNAMKKAGVRSYTGEEAILAAQKNKIF